MFECWLHFCNSVFSQTFIAHVSGTKICYDKKVLLRERKRHTARLVASARYAALCNGGGDTPGRGVPHLRSKGGVPHLRSKGGGTPSQVQGGYPISGRGVPHLRLGGYPGYPHPDLRWGPPLLRPGMGYPPYPDLRWGTPLPRPEIGYPPLPRPGMRYPPPT